MVRGVAVDARIDRREALQPDTGRRDGLRDGVDEALRESLTTVRQPQEEKGRRAGALLMSPSGSGVPIVEMLDTELLAGRTSGRIKG